MKRQHLGSRNITVFGMGVILGLAQFRGASGGQRQQRQMGKEFATGNGRGRRSKKKGRGRRSKKKVWRRVCFYFIIFPSHPTIWTLFQLDSAVG